MTTIITRLGKGSPLTNAEMDANLTNLNNDKLEASVFNDVTNATGEPMGFVNRTDSTIAFNNGTRVFTIQPVNVSYDVWTKGVKRTFTTSHTVTIPNTTGLYFIYFDPDGVLQYQTSFFNLQTETPVAYVYWNSSTSTAPFVADERHGVVLDWQTHEYLHRTRGAVIANGFSISNYTTSGTGSSNADAQFDLGGGTFFDEDLKVEITHSDTPTPNTFQQDLQGPARIPVFYLSGNAWVLDAPTDYALKQGTSRPAYNLNTSGTWTTPDVPNETHYTTSWIIATNNISYPVIAIMGQSHSNLIGDEEAINFSNLTLTGFPIVEFRPLYKVIWQVNSNYANTPNARIAAVYDLRTVASSSVSSQIASDHGALSGLGDDDHLQYVHIANDRTITANHTFTGNTTLATTTFTGQLRGPETFIIDPAAVGDNTGTVVIKGNLQIDGTTTTINSTTVTVDDKNIVLADGATNSSEADGAGITITGANATFNYAATGDKWQANKSIETNSQLISTVTGGTAPIVVSSTSLVSNLNSDYLDGQHGAYYLDWTNTTNKPSPVITLAGDLTGSVTLTSLGNGTLTATIAANSVALGTDTTGNYVSSVTGGTGITITGSVGEGWTPSISVDDTVVATLTGTQTLTNKTISGALNTLTNIPNSALTNSAVTIGTTSISLGASSTTLAGLTSVTSTSFVGALTGNASTATTLQTSRTIGDVSFNGSANIVPERILYKDTRAVDFTPYTYPGVTLHLKTNTTDGLSDGGTYHGVLNLQHWSDSSGGDVNQLAFTDNGNIHYRQSTSTSAWGSWAKIWHSANDGASSGLDADLLDGQDGSYYLDWTNVTNKPDPVITLAGDLTGSVTLTDLGSATLTATIAANSVALGTDTTGNYVVDVSAGAGIVVSHVQGEGSTATISHADTSSVSNLVAAARTYITGMTFDTYGHVLTYTTATETVTNTTYAISAETTTGGANLRLTGSDAVTDDVKIQGSGIAVVSRTDANTITVTATEADTFATVTGRGNTTTSTITHGGLVPSAGNNIDQINTFTFSLTLSTNWQDTGISTNNVNLTTGSYILQLTANDSAVGGGHINECYTGVMSWYAGGDVNSTVSDEVTLHRAGAAPGSGAIFLRVLRTVAADTLDLKLQIAGTTNNSSASNYTFKFRRLI